MLTVSISNILYLIPEGTMGKMKSADEYLYEICNQIIHSDSSIRFVAFLIKWVNWLSQNIEMD